MRPDADDRRFAPGPLLALPLTLVLALAVVPPEVAPAAAGEPDPEAAAAAQRTLEAMGGEEAWEATRFLRFNFFGFRLHHWDRYTGRHRLEGKNREGDSYLVLHNVRTREGEAWVNGERQQGDAAKEWLERAYGAWVNDSYWLLMPYKLRDPGVNLTYEGQEEIEGTAYDKLKLTFDGVGLTPGDTYWAWINRGTGLMDRWAYRLEGWEADRAPTPWLWQGWQTYGGVKLAPRRKNLEDGRETELGELAVFDQLPDAVFTAVELPEL
jgi:hypothetical protein